MRKALSSFHLLGPFVALAVIIGIPFLFWFREQSPVASSKLTYWLISIIALAAFILIVGHAISSKDDTSAKGRWLAALIDERNKMSLSRLQLFIWTVIVLSGYFTAALWNLFVTEKSDPLAVGLPPELWWLLGITTTSFVASPLILNTKTDEEPSKEVVKSVALQKGVFRADVPREGVVDKNESPDEAGLLDMFTGDEVGNRRALDMGKVQMFFFTILVVLAYGMSLGGLFVTTTGQIDEFPTLSESILVLLGISHAGYLAYKGVSHTETVTPEESEAARLRGAQPRHTAVEVPNLAGMTRDDAEDEFGDDFDILVVNQVRADQPVGTILKQEPKGEEVEEKGAQILVTVVGTQITDVPSVVGESLEAATRTLEDAGFEVQVEEKEIGGDRKGSVIEQNPGPGVTEGAVSVVAIMVGIEPLVKVPGLEGKDHDKVAEILENTELEVEYHEDYSDKPEGTITNQAPKADSKVQRGSRVDIWVSTGPEQVPDAPQEGS